MHHFFKKAGSFILKLHAKLKTRDVKKQKVTGCVEFHPPHELKEKFTAATQYSSPKVDSDSDEN